MSEAPLVSVIIATRDRPGPLTECLRALAAQDDGRLEVLVVDNSRRPEEGRALAREAGVRYLRADPEVANPAAIRNVGLADCKGSCIAFIDDDAIVQPGWLAGLRAGLVAPGVGAVTGRVIESNAPEVSSDVIGRFEPTGRITMNFNNTMTRPVPVDFVYGCNMAFRRDALERSGGFDRWYGIVYEEQDLSFRLRKLGYRAVWVPGMAVHHLRAPRTAGVTARPEAMDARAQFLNCRSLAYLTLGHFGLRQAVLVALFVRIPKGLLADFVYRRCPGAFGRFLAGLAGSCAGSFLAVARALRLHGPMPLGSSDGSSFDEGGEVTA